jgi:hypothetical protein
MDLKWIEWEVVDWTDLADNLHRALDLVNAVINFLISYKVGNLFTSWARYQLFKNDPAEWT